MTIKRRIQKLEARHGEGAAVKVIIRQIVWADGTVIAHLGNVLTSTGWRTLSAGRDTSESEFEQSLLAMVEGGTLSESTTPAKP